MLGFAVGECPTVTLFDGEGTLVDGELGFATPPVFGVMPPVVGVVWAKAKVLDRRTSAAVAQMRFMVWLRVRAPQANGPHRVTFPRFILRVCLTPNPT